jgi:hypothetical protein
LRDPEYIASFMDANCRKIRTRLRVLELCGADGSPMMFMMAEGIMDPPGLDGVERPRGRITKTTF